MSLSTSSSTTATATASAKTWLVSVDATDDAKAAFNSVVHDLAQPDRHDVIVIFTVEAEDNQAAADLVASYSRKLVQHEARLKLNKGGVSYKVQVQEGSTAKKDVGNAIVAAAVHHHADFIVMGARRGVNSLSKNFIGSVSEYVLRHSDVPVIIARAKQTDADEVK